MKKEGILIDRNNKIKFGKYNGKSLKQVSKNYIKWLIENDVKLSTYDLETLMTLNIPYDLELKIKNKL